MRDDFLKRYGLIKLNQSVVKVRACSFEKKEKGTGLHGTEGSKEGDSGDVGSGSDEEEDEALKLVRKKKGKEIRPEPSKKKGAQRPQAGKSIRFDDVPDLGEEEPTREGAEGGEAEDSFVNIMDEDDDDADAFHVQSRESPVVIIEDPVQSHLTEAAEGQADVIPPPPATGSAGVEASPGMSSTSWNFESVWGDLFLSEEAQVPHTHDDPSVAVPPTHDETHCDAPAATLSHSQGSSDFLDL